MGFPWRKLWSGIKTVVSIGGQFDKRLKVVDEWIDKVEDTMPDAPGSHKLETVQAVSDAAIEARGLPEAEEAEAKALRNEYIELGLEIRKASARSVEVSKRFAELLKG